jgi:tetratricopeptide (TPR) repeat protein
MRDRVFPMTVPRRAAFERALKIDEKAFSPDHPEVATDVNNLGSVLQDLGDLPAARAAFERALAIDEKTFGPDHPSVAGDVNNLGAVYQALAVCRRGKRMRASGRVQP